MYEKCFQVYYCAFTGVLPTESVKDTCIIEPDLEQDEIFEDTLDDNELVESETSSTKTGDEEENISLDFLVIEDEVAGSNIKADEEVCSQVPEVISTIQPLESELESIEEFSEVGNDNEDEKSVSVDKGLGEVEEMNVDDAKEVESFEEMKVDDGEEVGLAAQTLASFGFSLGLTVHGSALVFPAVALPRLKQVRLLFVLIGFKITWNSINKSAILGDNTRSC